MISEYNIRTLFTAPTAFRAIKKEDPNATYLKKYDIKCLRALFLAGERADRSREGMGGERSRRHDHEIAVEPGEIVTLIGANGAGKTALAALASRNMAISCTVQDGRAWVSDGSTTVEIEPQVVTSASG